MAQWFAQNSTTIVTIAVLLIAVGIAVFSLIREKKRPHGTCTGNCATCGMGCAAHQKKK